jgi:hypothetical protein
VTAELFYGFAVLRGWWSLNISSTVPLALSFEQFADLRRPGTHDVENSY